MTDAVISQLFDFGALGLFASFLIWQHLGMQKRLDALTSGFQTQLKEIEKSHEDRIEIMRGRYDEVIERVRLEGTTALQHCMAQRDELIAKLGEQIDEIAKKMDTSMIKQEVALAKIDEGLDEIRRERERRQQRDR